MGGSTAPRAAGRNPLIREQDETMSAFGRRPGTAGRPAFGVAKPMQTGPGVPGGAQFPAIDTPPVPEPALAALPPELAAMERPHQRSSAENREPAKATGCEASELVRATGGDRRGQDD